MCEPELTHELAALFFVLFLESFDGRRREAGLRHGLKFLAGRQEESPWRPAGTLLRHAQRVRRAGLSGRRTCTQTAQIAVAHAEGETVLAVSISERKNSDHK